MKLGGQRFHTCPSTLVQERHDLLLDDVLEVRRPPVGLEGVLARVRLVEQERPGIVDLLVDREFEAPRRLEVTTDWPQLDEGGVEALDVWLDRRPDARLVVVDTLKKIRPREAGSRSVYDLDYEALEPLVPLASGRGAAILVVHHLRKLEAGDPLDMISGSTGLTGGVDSALVLKRDRGKQDATLMVDGRDIEEPSELALRWDADIASWSLMGDAEEFRMSEERRGIVNLLRRVGEPLGPKDIAQVLGRNYGAVRVMLSEMVKDGLLASPSRGKYMPTNNTNNANMTNNTNNANNAHADENVSDVSDHGLTPDQSRRVQDLIAEGVAPKFARAEVLGEGEL